MRTYSIELMSSLELERIRNIAKEVFKILNGLSPMYLHGLVSLVAHPFPFAVLSFPDLKTVPI